MIFRTLICLLTIPAIAHCSERWFRKDGDGVNWVLMLDGQRYEIEFYRMDGRRTKAEGVTEETESSITFKEKPTPDGPTTVPSGRFLKKKVGDDLYLVREKDEKEFKEAVDEKDRFLRSVFLGGYFHQVPVKPFSQQRRANKAVQTTPGLRPFVSDL